MKEISGKPPFEAVYDSCYFPVFRYVSSRVNSRQDAEDLTADAFLYAYSHYADYDPQKSAVSTWLYLIVNSRLKNHYRDRRDLVDLEEVEAFLFAEGEELGRAVWLEQLRTALGQALLQLPERQQRAVIMRYFEEKDYAQIAAALETTEGNVRVVLSRALDKLEKQSAGLKDFL